MFLFDRNVSFTVVNLLNLNINHTFWSHLVEWASSNKSIFSTRQHFLVLASTQTKSSAFFSVFFFFLSPSLFLSLLLSFPNSLLWQFLWNCHKDISWLASSQAKHQMARIHILNDGSTPIKKAPNFLTGIPSATPRNQRFGMQWLN